MWLNFILKVSSIINKQKEKIIDAGILKTIGLAFITIGSELFQFIVSLPIYIFVKPEKFSSNKKEIEKYRLKRKYSLFGFFGFLTVIFLQITLTGGLFFSLPSTPVRAFSVSWGFDNPGEYIYDSSKIQITEGIAIYQPNNNTDTQSDKNIIIENTPVETISEPTPTETPNEQTAPTEPPSESVSWFKKILGVNSCYASVQNCVETIQPVSSLFVPDIDSWTGFVEIASKNGGEIYYQLSNDDGLTWYFYDGDWKVVEDDSQYNTAEEIDEKITKFPIENEKIIFKAFLASDCENAIQLINISINYTQKQLEQVQPLSILSEESINKATNKDNFKASVTNKGSAKDLAESEPLSATWTVNQGGDNLDIWVRYDMGENTKIGSYEITPTSDSLRTPKNWLFQGSDNIDGDYQTLDTQTGISDWSGESPKIFQLSQLANYRYYRILIQASNHESRVALARIRIFAYYERMYTVRSDQNDVKLTNASGNEIVSTAKGFYVNHKDVFGTDNQIAYLEIKDNVDLSSWIVGSDSSNNISVIHINDNDRSSIEKIRLIVKKNAGDDYVRVCPGATDIRDVRSGCENEIILTTDGSESGGYRLVEEDDQDNWNVENDDVNAFSTGIQSGAINPENGLVSLWKFDENTGCVANDSFGINHGALGRTCPGTSPTWTSGIFNSALSFTANNQRVTVPDSGNLDLTNKGSLVAWVNLSAYNNYGGIIHKGQLTNFSDSAYFMQMGGSSIPGSNNRKVICGGHDGITDRYFISNQELSLNTWYHLVYTWDESGQKMYINGALNASTTISVVNRVTTGSLQIGSQLPTSYFFRGKIDEPAIYNYALSDSQVASLYNNPVVASIEILTPNGGENLTGGQSQAPVRWNSLNTSGNVKIEYSKDNFVSDLHTIVDSTIDNGAYDWLNIPNDPSNTIKVRISDVSNPSIYDISDANFTIALPSSVTIAYPNGGENIFSNSFATIRWSSTNTSDNVKIEYSKDNFVSDIHTVVVATSDDGSYDWAVPNDPGTTVKIKISDVANSTVYDVSNNNFIISQSDSDPVGYWRFDDNSGCLAVDSFGGNDGTLSPSCPVNSPSWVVGKVNSTLDFDGSDDYVTIGNAVKLNPSTALTLSAWIKWDIDPTTGNQWATIINKNDDNQFRLQHNQTNTGFEFALRTSLTGNKWLIGNTVPQQGVWYFIAATYDGQTMKLYVNGALEKSTDCFGYIIGSNRPFNISKRNTNDRYFNGKIDEVGIWNRALSPSEIAQMYLEGNNTKPELIINSVSQQNNDGYVNIEYTLIDADSNFINLNEYKYSLTGISGDEMTMTPATVDPDHDGVTALSSSLTGIDHTFVWNAKADLGDAYDDSVWVSFKPSDNITQGNSVISPSFNVDTKNPVVTNVSANQQIDSNIVNIKYDLSDDNTDNLTIELAVSDDSGATWTVATTNALEDLGTGISAGNDKNITWDAGLDFADEDKASMKVRLRAKDKFQNTSIYFESNDFAVDTKDPFGLASFDGVSASASAIVWSWNPVVNESHFVGYELWYGTNLDDVENRSGTADKWDSINDNGLAIMGTASTSITGLTENTKYFAKIWAKDEFGHTTTLPVAELTTTISPDITAPLKPILDQPVSPRTDKELLISGIAEANSSLNLYVNGNKVEPLFATVTSTGSFSGKIELDLGTYELYATSTDAQGNVSDNSDSRFVEITTAKTVEITTIKEETQIVEKETIPTDEKMFTVGLTSPEKEIVQEIIESKENPILLAPEITTISANVIGNNINFSGTGIPNSEIVIFIHSDQAITYKVMVDKDGNWELSHSQSEVELEDGEHEVYGITLDSNSNIKSRSSSVTNFTVKKNYLAKLLSYFDIPTTLLTIILATIGIIALLISRKKTISIIK